MYFCLVFCSSDKVYLDFSDIYITYSLTKLSYYCLKPYKIEKQAELILYHLKLFYKLQRIYPVFSVIKLTVTSNNPISERYLSLYSNLVIIDREKEWGVKKILNN